MRYYKDPDEVLDYQIDWSSWLGSDTIATSVWSVPSGITQDSETETTTTSTIWLSGGTEGEVYELRNRIVTNAGRTADRTIKVEIRSR